MTRSTRATTARHQRYSLHEQETRERSAQCAADWNVAHPLLPPTPDEIAAHCAAEQVNTQARREAEWEATRRRVALQEARLIRSQRRFYGV
jgi:hypothetical protein